MSAPNTSSTPAAPAVDLDAGKDLTALDDASLLGELGFSAPEGADATPAEPTSAELENEVVNSVIDRQPEVPAEPEPAAPDADEPTPNEPEPAAPDAKDQPALAAQFQVFDQEGELEIPRDFAITFTADGGKKFEKVPLDKVVRLAQQGQYNHRLQQEVQAARETQTRLSQMDQQLAAEREARERTVALAERLLTDPAFFDQALAEYEAYNAPDAVIARQRAEIEALRQRKAAPTAGASDAEKAQAFFTSTAVPAIEQIVTQFPAVTQQELLGQFMLLTAPLQVNGKIPPARFADVERILVNELAPWAQEVHEQRSALETERKRAALAAEKAKQASANTKRQLARAIRPTGRPAPDVAPGKAPRDADEAADQILAGILTGA